MPMSREAATFSSLVMVGSGIVFFFFNDTATTEIYTLSLHDALPISIACRFPSSGTQPMSFQWPLALIGLDRKSTRLNSSHVRISYAVFCLKKKAKTNAERRGIEARTVAP